MSSKKAIAGVDNTFRKTWDKAEYADKANERDRKEKEDPGMDDRKRKRIERDPLLQGIVVQRANLKARDFQIDLASKLNKTQVTSLTAPLSQQAGYYCDVCECVLKDSISYLDHINGKWHNRALGMSMKIEKSTAEQVRQRLEEAKRRKKGIGTGTSDELDEKEALKEHIPDGMTRQDLGLQNKKKNGQEEEEDDDDEDENETYGIRQEDFATNTTTATTDNGDADNKDKKNRDEDELDPEFIAMMGFGGFGGSKKN